MLLGAVMPTYNQARFIEAAIKSVAGQVDALVVVDDGSPDESSELAWKLGIPTVRHAENRGTAAAINTGVAALPDECDWLTWVSSDNVMDPLWRKTLEAHVAPDVGAVHAAFTWARGEERRRLFVRHEPDRLINQEDCYYGPAFIIRRSAWQSHRGRISHDYDNWLRVEEACWAQGLRIISVDVDLCHYNAHDERVTLTRRHEYDVPRWQAEARVRRGLTA